MDNYAELVGYAASAIVAISFMFRDISILRIVNTLGAITFTTYGFLIDSIPVIITNVFIGLINLYFLYRAKIWQE